MKPLELLKPLNLLLIFLLELAVLVAAGYWGFARDAGRPVRILLGIGTPVVLAALWSLLGAPDATYKTRGAVRVGAGGIRDVVQGARTDPAEGRGELRDQPRTVRGWRGSVGFGAWSRGPALTLLRGEGNCASNHARSAGGGVRWGSGRSPGEPAPAPLEARGTAQVPPRAGRKGWRAGARSPDRYPRSPRPRAQMA
ncbi:YrdB family protein [Streptomyces violascens]|uniref:DUF2568 domain-containing protein n=2 Tax=Streptomyces violascens TaxID=67381 RepID=A0ABQ3QKP5_9ACTN|nr:YrdB family protein [Streptomyces violascens]GGT92801.1 hypothetical protein GCM10010289_10950 [Streptomyces violascens]GHI37856.1 hypothetical protein Sviol_22640 [Streptomyces violascens]